jgi:hypothetical protein
MRFEFDSGDILFNRAWSSCSSFIHWPHLIRGHFYAVRVGLISASQRWTTSRALGRPWTGPANGSRICRLSSAEFMPLAVVVDVVTQRSDHPRPKTKQRDPDSGST